MAVLDSTLEEAKTAAAQRSAARSLRLLAAALVLLVTAGVSGLVADWHSTRAFEQHGAVHLATGVQAHVTEVLRQAHYSLKGIRQEVQSGTDPVAALRQAMRFDPASHYLGLRSGGTLLVVEVEGQLAPMASLPGELTRELDGAPDADLTVLPAIWSAARREWYLVLRERGDAGGVTGDLFALIPVFHLVDGTSSLRMVPETFVSAVRNDGVRLFQYIVDDSEVRVDRNAPLSPQARAALARGGPTSFEALNQVTGRNMLLGIAPSALVPMTLGVGFPLEVRNAIWMKRVAGHIVLLVVATAAGLIFLVRLKMARDRELVYLRHQERLARHDPLTGLENRQAFQRRLKQAIAERPARKLLVLILGLRKFKEVNETLGFQAGDATLVEVGRRLQKAFAHGEGFVARLGGDEMVVCAPLGVTDSGVEAFSRCVSAVLAAPVTIDDVALELSAAQGVAIYPDDGAAPAELLRCADIALAAAKRELVSFARYSEALDHYTPEGLALKAELSRALREGGVALVYQPKVDLRSGTMAGVEALARWRHPTKGPISPGVFIPLVEASELIHPFTRHVLREALAQCHRWQLSGYRVPVSVNISAVNLIDAGFVPMVRAAMAEHQVPAALLELEVTESALMRNPESALRRLEELRALGVRLSIDDFGTGYASLAYLKRLPVDVLKIDKTFTANLEFDDADRRIVRSTIELAHSFGMAVVAEGVESERAAELLRNKGCDVAQGFFFARPLLAEEVEAQWLAKAPSPCRCGVESSRPRSS